MARTPFNPQFVSVYSKNNAHLVVMPDGNELIVTVTSVKDPDCEIPMVTLEAFCNIVSSREEAIELYKQHKDEIQPEQ